MAKEATTAHPFTPAGVKHTAPISTSGNKYLPNLNLFETAFFTRLLEAGEVLRVEMSAADKEAAEALVNRNIVEALKVKGQRHIRAYTIASDGGTTGRGGRGGYQTFAGAVTWHGDGTDFDPAPANRRELAARINAGEFDNTPEAIALRAALAGSDSVIDVTDTPAEALAIPAEGQVGTDANGDDLAAGSAVVIARYELAKLDPETRAEVRVGTVSDKGFGEADSQGRRTAWVQYPPADYKREGGFAFDSDLVLYVEPIEIPFGLNIEEAGRLLSLSMAPAKVSAQTKQPGREPYLSLFLAGHAVVGKSVHKEEYFLRPSSEVTTALYEWKNLIDGQQKAGLADIFKMIDEERVNARLVMNGHPDKQTYQYAREPRPVYAEQPVEASPAPVAEQPVAPVAEASPAAKPAKVGGRRPEGSTAGFYAVNFTPTEAVAVWFANGVAARQAVAALGNTSSHVVGAVEFDEREQPTSFINKMNFMNVPYRVATAFGPAPAQTPAPASAASPAAPSQPNDISPAQLDIMPAPDEAKVDAARKFAGGWIVGGMDFAKLDDATRKTLGSMMSAGEIKSEFDGEAKKSIYKLTPAGEQLLVSAGAPVAEASPAPVERQFDPGQLQPGGETAETIQAEFVSKITVVTTQSERRLLWQVFTAGSLRFDVAEERGQAATCAKLCRLGAMGTAPSGGGGVSTWVAREGEYLELARQENENPAAEASPLTALRGDAWLDNTEGAEHPDEAAPARGVENETGDDLTLSPLAADLLDRMVYGAEVAPADARVLATVAAKFLLAFDEATNGEALAKLAEAGVEFLARYNAADPDNFPELPSAVEVVFIRDEVSVAVFVAIANDTDEGQTYTSTDDLLTALRTEQLLADSNDVPVWGPVFALCDTEHRVASVPEWVPVLGRPEYGNLDKLLDRLRIFESDRNASQPEPASPYAEQASTTEAEPVPAEAIEQPAAWLRPTGSQRAHYFEAGSSDSLCEDWLVGPNERKSDIFAGAGLTQCAKCAKLLAMAPGSSRWVSKVLTPVVLAALDKHCAGLGTELVAGGVKADLLGPAELPSSADNVTASLVMHDDLRQSLKIGLQLIEYPAGGQYDIFLLSLDGALCDEPTPLADAAEHVEKVARYRFRMPRPFAATAKSLDSIVVDKQPVETPAPVAEASPAPAPFVPKKKGDAASLADEQHKWDKKNNFTQSGRGGAMFDTWYCETCGLTGKRYGLSENLVVSKTADRNGKDECRPVEQVATPTSPPAGVYDTLAAKLFEAPASTTATGDELLGDGEPAVAIPASTELVYKFMLELDEYERELLLDLFLDRTGDTVLSSRIGTSRAELRSQLNLTTALNLFVERGYLDTYIERERGAVQFKPLGAAVVLAALQTDYGQRVGSLAYRRESLGLSDEVCEVLAKIDAAPLAATFEADITDALLDEGLIELAPAAPGVGEHYVLTPLGRSMLPAHDEQAEQPTEAERLESFRPGEFLQLTPAAADLLCLIDRDPFGTHAELTSRIADDEAESENGERRIALREVRDDLLNDRLIYAVNDETGNGDRANCYKLTTAGREAAASYVPPVAEAQPSDVAVIPGSSAFGLLVGIDNNGEGMYSYLEGIALANDNGDAQTRADRDTLLALGLIAPGFPKEPARYEVTAAGMQVLAPNRTSANGEPAPQRDRLADCATVASYFAKYLLDNAPELYEELGDAEVRIDCYELAEFEASPVVISLQGGSGRRFGIELALRDDERNLVLKTATEQAEALEAGRPVVPMVLETRGTGAPHLDPLDGIGVLNNLAGSVGMYFNLGTAETCTPAPHPVADSVSRHQRREAAEAAREQREREQRLGIMPLPHAAHGGPAFPGQYDGGPGEGPMQWAGISSRLYLAAHAPAVVPEWFTPDGPRPVFNAALDIERILMEKLDGPAMLDRRDVPGDVARIIDEAREAVAEQARAWDVRRLGAWPLYWADLILAKDAAETK